MTFLEVATSPGSIRSVYLLFFQFCVRLTFATLKKNVKSTILANRLEDSILDKLFGLSCRVFPWFAFRLEFVINLPQTFILFYCDVST